MNDQQIGAAFRAVRIRRRLRQVDVARMAAVSPTTISRLERGHFGYLSQTTLRRVAGPLDIRLELVARWRGGDLDRLVNARHSALHESVAGAFAARPGWEVRPEVSFAIYGERGIVDILAWHATRRALLVIELKTEIVDVNELMGTIDRKRRLAPSIARDLGWTPASVSVWVVVAEGRTNRRRITEHRAVLRAALPADGAAMDAWLDAPSTSIAALSMWPVARLRSSLAPTKRVRMPASRGGGAATDRA
jgi:transcriptional regulator with XRE-family HTH domain